MRKNILKKTLALFAVFLLFSTFTVISTLAASSTYQYKPSVDEWDSPFKNNGTSAPDSFFPVSFPGGTNSKEFWIQIVTGQNNPLYNMNSDYRYSIKIRGQVYSYLTLSNTYTCSGDISLGGVSGSKSLKISGISSDRHYIDYSVEFEVTDLTNIFGLTLSFNFSGTYIYSLAFSFSLDVTVYTPNGDIIEQFGSNYSSPDTSAFDEYNKAESEAMDIIHGGGGGQFNSQFSGLDGTLFEYQGAFLGFNNFFNQLTGIPWLGTVITISVAVGTFALLLGAIGHISKRGGD